MAISLGQRGHCFIMRTNAWLLGALAVAATLAACSSSEAVSDGNGIPIDGGDRGPPGNGSTPGGDGGGSGGVDAGDGGGLVSPTLSKLVISPAALQLVVKGNTAVVQPFTVAGTFSDGHTEDVTSQAAFSIDDARLGTFVSGSSFTSGTAIGGTSFVRARVGTTSASTGITVKLERSVSDSPPAASGLPPVPATPETKFGGAVDGTYKPKIVYPNDGVMVPPNVGPTEIHFLPKNASTTLFELAFTNGSVDLRVHLRCYLPADVTAPAGERGCIYTPDEEVWKLLAESNRGGQAVKLTVRAADDTGTGTVGVSDPISIEFARTDVKGALYYSTTAGGTGVMRHDFADASAKQATPVLRTSNVATSVSCVGCHAVSPNGKTLVAEVNGQNDGRLVLVDLSHPSQSTNKSPLARSGAKLSNFQSWSPDGSRFVGVYADSGATSYNLRLFNGTTAAFEGDIANTGTQTNPANHPDWSADGKTIAYQSMGIAGTNQRSYKGAIKVVTSTATGWNDPVTVVPSQSGRNRYYPAIAPDNSFLVFNESQCPTGEAHTHCNGDSDPSARLWAVPLGQSGVPIDLVKANLAGPMDSTSQLTNSFPKWSPFVGRGNKGETSRLLWMTFASTRNYGLRTTPSLGGSENDKAKRLWMAAVDPDQVKQGSDPSYAAFALPFQELGSAANHVAQWTKYFVSNGCSTVGEGCGSGGSCCNGLQCVQPDKNPVAPCDGANGCQCQDVPQCAAAFQKCSTAAPCCDGLRCLDDATGGDCQGNSCTCTPPCSGSGQACGGSLACCDGLSCASSPSGNTCR